MPESVNEMDDCPECAKWREKGAKFCGNCGKQFEVETPKRSSGGFEDILWKCVFLGIIASAIVMVLNIAYMGYNFGYFADLCNKYQVKFSLSLGLWSWTLFKYTGIWMCVDLVICLVIEAACLAYALRTLNKVRKADPTDSEAQLKTGYSATIMMMCLSLFLGIVSILAIAAAGGGLPDSSWISSYDDVMMQYLLTRAGVYEEFVDRVVLMGVPMVVIGYLAHRDRKSWQYLFGGFGMSKATFALLIFSATMFGLAHYDGWGWAKVPDAFIGGIIFGYLYAEYGLYASILAHTINDTMGVITLIMGIGWILSLAYLALGFLVLLWCLMKPRRELLDVKGMANVPPKIEGSFLQNWGRH